MDHIMRRKNNPIMQVTQIIENIENIRRNIGRMAMMGTLAAIMVTALAACGSGATGTDSGSNPTATVAASEPTATAMTSASDSAAPTDTPSSADGMSEAPTQTPATANNDAATPTQAAAGQGGGSATQINATLREWAIDLSQKEVPAGNIQFTVNNQGMMPHNLTVLDSNGNKLGQTPTFASSEGPQTLEVTLTSGTYTLICSLPGHAQRGQMTQLVVK
jgi:uncharacterized cupredoxin-like copper-binding protein